jgi:hypothetical protein
MAILCTIYNSLSTTLRAGISSCALLSMSAALTLTLTIPTFTPPTPPVFPTVALTLTSPPAPINTLYATQIISKLFFQLRLRCLQRVKRLYFQAPLSMIHFQRMCS